MRPLYVWHIDDEDVFRRLFQIFCRRRQLRVVVRSFQEARAALDLALQRGDQALPDLIVLDLRMPGFDGFEFLNGLNAGKPAHGIPIFVLSSSTDVNDIIEAHAAGATSYYSKHEVEDLLGEIRSMCGSLLDARAAG